MHRAPPEKSNAAGPGGTSGVRETDQEKTGDKKSSPAQCGGQGLDVVVASFPKNEHYEFRVLLRTWKGCRLVDQRLFAPGLTGQLRPTHNGVAMPIEKLPEIVKALQEAEREARRLGLIPDAAT